VNSIPDRPRRRADVVLRELGTEAMLYDPSGDRVIRLNATAQRIWTCCDGTRDFAGIVASLRESFDVGGRADLEGDVRQTLTAFAGAGLFDA
jgi:hypothetical protein